MMCSGWYANVAGEKLPPLLVFKCKIVWDLWISKNEEFPGLIYDGTNNWWMKTIENYFPRTLWKACFNL